MNPKDEAPIADQYTYARLFESNDDGLRVMQDLERRFCRPAKTEGGIDAVLQTYHRAGARAVVEFILARINQANGVEPNDD